MKKRGLLLFLGILIGIVLLLVAAGIYFYNFHVFKTVRVCLTEGNDTGIPCNDSQICRDFAMTIIPDINLSDAPDFVSSSFDKIIEESIYCDSTCHIREVRGINSETQELELLDSCEEGEIEVKADIRGKDAVELLRWGKSQL